jgi:hypothetical protein
MRAIIVGIIIAVIAGLIIAIITGHGTRGRFFEYSQEIVINVNRKSLMELPYFFWQCRL